MPDIVHELEIAAQPKAVFDAVNSEEGNRSFWTDQTTYDPSVGSVATFGFGPNAETEFHFRIDSIEPPRRLEWFCVNGPDEWKGTRVRWTLDPVHSGTATKLRFEHLGWRSADGALGSCSFTWARILERLDTYVTHGARNPAFALAPV